MTCHVARASNTHTTLSQVSLATYTTMEGNDGAEREDVRVMTTRRGALAGILSNIQKYQRAGTMPDYIIHCQHQW